MRFYLGVHRANWMVQTDVPLFVSRRTLTGRKSLPLACGLWALDSGGFSELSMFGTWTLTAKQYANEVVRFTEEIGSLAWAAIQDWMCEPQILRQTGLTVRDHQERTVQSYLDLREMGFGPWLPVLQGWEADDYFRHVDLYQRHGVDLSSLPLVGLGSICRRQALGGITRVASRLRESGIHLHGFGVKVSGLRSLSTIIDSADSMAWSFRARKLGKPMLGCHHKNCANCLRFALDWRDRLLASLRTPYLNQGVLL